MSEEYATGASSGVTTDLEDIPLDHSDDMSETLTRRILRPMVVVNKKDATQPLRVTILHQRRSRTTEPWQDVNSFNQARLKAGEEVRMALSCSQTYRLYRALGHLYAISEGGLPAGGKRFAVVDPERATVVEGEQHCQLKAILDREGDGFWTILEDLQPGLLQSVMLRKQYEARRATVEEFRRCIDDPTIGEDAWQEFFEKNEWVFGHGLDYRYLRRLQAQPSYGGVEIDGTGGLRGDYLMVTVAHVRFTVLVEIKKPFTELLGKKQYRSKAYELGSELTGAVAQVQAQCAYWALEGSRQSSNWERLFHEGIHTCEPKGIIVIGTTHQIADDPEKRTTFERFRRNLHNPEIITFDELLARAEFMVEQLVSARPE